MVQAGFDAIAASRRLNKAGFGSEQAEAVVETLSEANALTQQVARDLADLKAYVHENMATRDDLLKFATKEDLHRFATREELFATRDELRNQLNECVKKGEFKAELAVLKADIFRFGLIATGLLTTLILGLAGMIAYQSWAVAQFLML